MSAKSGENTNIVRFRGTFNKGVWIDINNQAEKDVLIKEKTVGFNKDLFNG